MSAGPVGIRQLGVGGGGGAETDRPGDSAVQGVEAAEWQRRPQQITFLSRPRSKNGWVVFSGLSL